MLSSIQALRAIAALGVLVFHATRVIGEKLGVTGAFSGGAAGVDLFFVLSGFIIYWIYEREHRGPADFAVRRMNRIAPPYWLYTTLTVILLIVAPWAYGRLELDPQFAIFSYLFLLSPNPAGNPGVMLGVGWTIAFEMYFYTVFTLGILLRPKNPMIVVAPVMLCGLAVWLSGVEVPAFATVFASPLPLEFLTGCLLSRLYLARKFLPSWVSVPGIVLAVLMIGLVTYLGTDEGDNRVIFFGIPAVILFYSVVSLAETNQLSFPKWMLEIGDSSYSLYLSHRFVLTAFAIVAAKFGFEGSPVLGTAAMIAGVLASIVFGWLSFKHFEVPVTAYLNKIWRSRLMIDKG